MNIADMRVEVTPGAGMVGRWGGVVLVVLGDLAGPGVAELVSIVRESPGGRALAYRLGAFMGQAGPGGVPDYCVLADGEEGDGPLVVLHGAASVHATGPGVDETISGSDRPTWVDEFLPAATERIEAGAAGSGPGGGGLALDLADGSVPGSGAVLVARDAAVAVPDEPEEVEDPDEPEAEEGAEPVQPSDFRRVELTPVTDDEARAPLPVAGPTTEGAEGEAVAPEGALVEGVRCIRSHFNHPEARYCSHCGIGMVQQTHILVSDVRPPLGILVFDDGTTLSLDANYVIGRDPSRDESVASGSSRPFVLADPDQVLSRVHAEIRLTGWEVELVDRDSANGTYVAGDDGDWERIAPGTPFILTPGMQARVGRQEFVFDSHHRRA